MVAAIANRKGRVFTGARAKVFINGVLVGYGTDVNQRETLEFSPVKVLGNIEVAENVPVDYRVSFSMGFVRLVGESLKSQGFWPKSGSSPQEHLQNILNQAPMTIHIEDSKAGTVLMILEEAQPSMRGMTISATGIVGENTDWVGIKIRDESEQ